MGLASRFLGTDGRARLIEALEQQEILTGEREAVLEIAAVASVSDVAPAEC